MGFGADLLKNVIRSPERKTAEIGICTSLKSENYFHFVSRVKPTTFLSRMQNWVKISKELWT